jgi:DNA-binding LacI/PurR family transcriptional regulator
VSSIGLAEGVRHATTDDAGGIAQLVDHLVLTHGHQRIAFVTGNPSNAEAQTRLAAYADALRRHALP